MSNIDPIPRRQPENLISLKDLWHLSLYHWPWFVVSLLFCISIGVIYLKTSPKIYQRSASVLIKQDGKGNNISSTQSDELSDIGLLLNKTNIYNEQRHLESLDILMEAARRLSLNIQYLKEKTLRDEPLYGKQLPFIVGFADNSEDLDASFNVYVGDHGVFTLFDFIIDGIKQYDSSINITVDGDSVTTPVGKLVIHSVDQASVEALLQETIHVSHSSLLSAASRIRSSLKSSISDEKSTIIDLEYKDVSARRAEDILNTVVSVYNDKGVADKHQLMLSTSQFIDERLMLIEKELSNVDSDISNYKSSHGITDIEAASSMYLNQYSRSDAEILSLNNQLSLANYIRDFLSDKSKSHTLLPANSGLTNSSILAQIQAYNTQLLQLNSHLSYTSAQNPVIGNMEEQLSVLRDGVMQSLNNEIDAISLQLSSYEQYSGDASAKIESNPDQAKYLLSVERQQKVKESLYLYLLQKREENDLSQSFVTFNGQMLDMPHGDPSPVAPNSRNILLGSVLLGLFIPLVFVFVQENMNNTVRGRRDLDGRLSMPFLGEVPLFVDKNKRRFSLINKKYNYGKRDFLVKDGSYNMINEAFRAIRTNLEFMTTASSQGAVFSIASYQPGSGKTFISVNLAGAFAIKNYRTLIIDGDLRHATVSSYFGRPKLGLSDYLGEKIADIQQVLVLSDKFPSLTVLPVGSIPPNPTELLSSPLFPELIQKLRSQFEYIIIDCPPSGFMADTTIIERQSDRTLFVIRVGMFEREQLDNLEQEYQENKNQNMSLILNGSLNDDHYGYSYAYNYVHSYSQHQPL